MRRCEVVVNGTWGSAVTMKVVIIIVIAILSLSLLLLYDGKADGGDAKKGVFAETENAVMAGGFGIGCSW